MTLKVESILKKNRVIGLFHIDIQVNEVMRTKRSYKNRPEEEIVEKHVLMNFVMNHQACEKARRRMGWRVYATNAPKIDLSLDKAVLAYRNEYIIEHGFSRLKGHPLSLSPTYLQREDHVVGLVRLLSIALRFLCLSQFVIRRNLSENDETEISGLYPGNPKRSTAKPTIELVLRAFKNINLSVVHLPEQKVFHITNLSEVQQFILQLLEFPPDLYQRLSGNSLNRFKNERTIGKKLFI